MQVAEEPVQFIAAGPVITNPALLIVTVDARFTTKFEGTNRTVTDR